MPVRAVLAETASLARAADQVLLRGWRDHLLCGPQERERNLALCAAKKPYLDPILARSPKKYADFISELRRRGLVRFTPCNGNGYSAGACFVLKKNKRHQFGFRHKARRHVFQEGRLHQAAIRGCLRSPRGA